MQREPAVAQLHDEEVDIRNTGGQPVPLVGWRITDLNGTRFWLLDATDGTVNPNQAVIVRRRRRAMALNNTGEERIILLNTTGETVDEESYTGAASGFLIEFN